MVDRTPDGRWIVVDGRRWRAADPEIPAEVRTALLHHLGVARSAVRTARADGDEEALRRARTRVHAAKTGLGERGAPWWDQDAPTRTHRWTEALRTLTAS